MELPSTRFHWLVLLPYQCHLYQSIYSHIIDKTETRGIDAIKLPKRLSFFAISETSTIIPDDINTFIK